MEMILQGGRKLQDIDAFLPLWIAEDYEAMHQGNVPEMTL